MPNAFTHQLFDFARLIGMRDRLRCPMCQAVGAWKPHGGWMDFADERKVRRWLCKWCGWYRGPEGYRWCQLGETAWEIADEESLTAGRDTPMNRCYGAFPWRG